MHPSGYKVPLQESGAILYFMPLAISIFLFMLSIIGVYVRQKCKRTERVTWISNEIYDNEESDCPIESTNIGVIYGIDITKLPEWLRKRRQMIFPQSSVEKGEQLGRGQFGAVFKGNLTQGNAVYVNLTFRI